MKKAIITALIGALLISSTAHAETIFEEMTESQITKGVTYKSVDTFTDSGWIRADIVRVDLTDPDLELKVLTPSSGTSKLSNVKTMAEENKTKAAINADFFNLKSGETNMLGMLYQNGKLISTPSKDNFASFAISDENKVIFDYFTFEGTLYAENTSLIDFSSCELYQINKVPVTTGGITMITSAYGSEVTVPAETYAMICEKSEEDGDDKFVMTAFSWGGEKVAIPENGAIFTANYSVNAFLNTNFAIGDTIRVETKISPDIESIREASGGNTILVKDNEIYPFTSNITGKNPRSAMGLSPSGKTLVLVTIDGREDDCAGFTQTELAEFMLALGCSDAINLDGGGSSTLVTEDRLTGSQVVQNSVSSLRKVSTAVGIISSLEPLEEAFDGEIKLSRNTIVLGDSIEAYFTFYDENYNNIYSENPIITSSDEDAIVEGNRITFSTPGEHYVWVDCHDITLEASVTVLDDIFAINIYPEVANTTSSDRSFTVTAYDRSGLSAPIPSNLLTFEVTGDVVMDSNIAKKGEGKGTVTAVFGSLQSTAVVNGEKYERPDDFSDPDIFQGYIEDGEKITFTGAVKTPKNLIGRFHAKKRLEDLITRGDVYALSEVYDPTSIFTVYRLTNGFTERYIENTRVITIANSTSSSFFHTDSTAWGKLKNICENLTESNLVIATNEPIYNLKASEKRVWDYYMKLLIDKEINVFVVSAGEKSEVTVENGVRYLYVGSAGITDNLGFDYNLTASSPLTLTFKGDEIKYTYSE